MTSRLQLISVLLLQKHLKVIVTGGQGFLGRHVANKLYERHEVITIGSQKYNSTIPHLKCDLLDFTKIDALVKSVGAIDCIVHTAGHSRELESVIDPIKYFQQNLEVTLYMLEVSRKYDIKKFVYSSTYLVYGDNRSEKVTEDHPLNPRSIYAGTKAAGEKLSLSYGYSYGIDMTIFRQGLFYGVDDDKKRVITSMIYNARKHNQIDVYGDKVIDFVHVDDASMAYSLLLTNYNSGIYNIGSGKGINLTDVAKFVKSKINPRAEIVIHDRRPTDIPHFVADISKAREVLGFEPRIDLFEFISEQAELP